MLQSWMVTLIPALMLGGIMGIGCLYFLYLKLVAVQWFDLLTPQRGNGVVNLAVSWQLSGYQGGKMSNEVFADGVGLFHKKSGGSGKAFPDVCLSPPPPPTGPVPVPYPNSLKASDLTGGSKSVKVQGAETALEDSSTVKTSAGDEGGTQGGNVVTHKTKGTGFFMLWSFNVQIEGKGVCRHDDPMGQNCASSPMGAADIKAMVNKAVIRAFNPSEPCTTPYDSGQHRHSMVKAQYDTVADGPCWQCGSISPLGNDATGSPLPHTASDAYTPDHQAPVMVRWYDGGCNKSDQEWKDDFQDPSSVHPHCHSCSNSQGGGLGTHSAKLAEAHAQAAADAATRSLNFFSGFL